MTKSLFSLLSDLPLRQRVSYIALAIFALVVSLYLLVIWPHTAFPSGYETLKPLERFTMVNEKRRTAVQIVGGVFFFVTAYFTFRNVLATEANAKIAREKHEQDKFFKATENLDSDKLSTRIGAIHTLGSIGSQSKPIYSVIIEVLSAFVTQKTPLLEDFKPERQNWIDTDIQAAVRAIGQLQAEHSEVAIIMLQKLNLANLILADKFIIGEAKGYNLNLVVFDESCLFYAFLAGCDFQNASFRGCDLRGANFKLANCRAAKFDRCKLSGTGFEDTILGEADLRGVDLSEAIGLHQEQVDSARISPSTKLPPNLKMPPPEKLEKERENT